jgi:hypothetical protein
MEKTEVFRSFNRWLQEKHTGADVVCEINRYDELLSIDSLGTVIRADSLLQIRYSDTHGNKRSARKVEPESPGDTDGNNR